MRALVLECTHSVSSAPPPAAAAAVQTHTHFLSARCVCLFRPPSTTAVLEQLAQEQVASGALTQAEADAGLVVVRVINHAITQRLTAADDEGDEYDEAFAKQAADYSAAAYYDGAPDQALNWQAQNSNFELGTKVSKPYWGSELSAYTGIDRSKNLSMCVAVGVCVGVV
jgi:hypothetical protein